MFWLITLSIMMIWSEESRKLNVIIMGIMLATLLF